jgi:hypothetical protein
MDHRPVKGAPVPAHVRTVPTTAGRVASDVVRNRVATRVVGE